MLCALFKGDEQMMTFLMVLLVLAGLALVYVVMQLTYTMVRERKLQEREQQIDRIAKTCGYNPERTNDVWRSHVSYFLDRKYPSENIVRLMKRNDEEYIL
jgi:hypothetical protein